MQMQSQMERPGDAHSMSHDVFISYSQRDKPVADAVCAILESERIRCWIAPRDVLAGANYAQAIVEAIRKCRILILIFSSTSEKSPHVAREAERALSRGLTIIPFRIENIAPSGPLEYLISTCHWLDALTPPLEQHIKRLAGAVRAHLDVDSQQVSAAETLGLRGRVRLLYVAHRTPDAEDAQELLSSLGMRVDLVRAEDVGQEDRDKHSGHLYHHVSVESDQQVAEEMRKALMRIGISVALGESDAARPGWFALWVT